MKKNYLFKNTGRFSVAIGLFAVALLSSCLKDTSPGTIDFSKSPALVGWQYNGFDATPLTTKLHAVATASTAVKITMSVPSVTLGSAVTVNIADDPTDAKAYADANGGNLLPTSLYTINNTSVTIPAGQQYGVINISFKGNVIDFSQNYVLGLKITGANGAIIASNLNVVILNLTLQSAYEGRFTATGSFVDQANGAIDDNGIYPDNIELLTVSANVVDWYEVTDGIGYGHPIDAGGLSYFGVFSPEFDFDPAGSGKIVAVVNHFGQTNSRNRAGQLDPSGVNASSGTPGTVGFKIQVKYIMVQAGVPSVFFNETYTYTGPI